MPKFLSIVRVHWNPRMSSKRLKELLNTPNIHEDDEDAILGELQMRDAEELPYDYPCLDYSLQRHEAMGGPR
jgi:hypothetical protein